MTTLAQLWPWQVAVVSIFSLAGQFVLVTGIAFVVLCLLASYLRFLSILDKAKDEERVDLKARNAFQLWVIERLGTAHREPEPFGVMLIDPRTDPSGNDADPDSEILMMALELVRSSVRQIDKVELVEGGRIGVVTDASREENKLIVERVLGVLRERPHKLADKGYVRFYARAGLATFPENGEKWMELIQSTTEALEGSSESGTKSFRVSEHEAETHEQELHEDGSDEQDSALVDPLTGVLKSRFLPKAMPKFIAKHRKQGEPVALMHIDLDRLAKYNEHYGSSAGDVLLKGIGEVLQRCLREDDLIARYGEDDFVALLTSPASGAQAAAQRIMAEIKRTKFMFGSKHLKAAVSVGISECPEHGRMPRQLLDAAECALRAAKEKGGGLCMVFDRSMLSVERPRQHVDRF